ncbi:MAG: type II toxin-antitoxin system RelE/ParE family toxin [Metallibacterium scheffleri]
MRVAFLPEAESEHLKQVAYYEAQQTGLGARYLAEVNAALEYICEAPLRFPIARPPALRRLGLRRFPFTIFFRELSGVVQVVAVAPHRRRPGYWSGRF